MRFRLAGALEGDLNPEILRALEPEREENGADNESV